MRDLLNLALNTAQMHGANYADVRFRKSDSEIIYTQDEGLKNLLNDEDMGVSIRVLKNGRWGFAATQFLDKESITRAAQQAVFIADSTASINQKNISLTRLSSRKDYFETKVSKDPFSIPLQEKIDLLLEVNEKAKKTKEIKQVTGVLRFKKFHQILLTSEGSDLENKICTSSGTYRATAAENGDFQFRSFQENGQNAGFEWIESQDLLGNAERVAQEAVQKLKSPKCGPGTRDIILMPDHMSLTIHESVGHPTELDRVLGWEANFAGTSFATTEKLGNFQYGSDIVNFEADNTMKGGVATWGWDDDGVPGQKWDVIKDGVLVDYGTTRETASFIDKEQSRGCNRADSYHSQPINRIPNIGLKAGKEPLSLDDLIANTEDGILITGRDSFSIDQRRYNFQFGGDYFQEIKNGKIVGTLRDVTYQSITPEFWNSCDAICDDRFWQPIGIMNCGKGEPMQLAQMTHGSAPARFKNISIGGALNG